MIVAFFESVKYAGHMVPVALLRIYIGYYFFNSGMDRYQGDYLVHPRLAAAISDWLPNSTAPAWYQGFLEEVVVPNWKVFAYLITYCEFVIGASFLIGFLVRPVALLGIFLSLNFIYNTGYPEAALHQNFLAVFVAMLWVGAGRSLGFDYFFFKRHRGLWW